MSSSSEIYNIIQEEEVIFKKNTTAGLPEISKLTDSAISKRGDQRKHSLLEKKKILHKRKIGFTMNTQKYRITWSIVLWSNRLMNFTKYFLYLKMFSIQCRKNIIVEDNKKRMNIANFINIYINIYTYIICDENDSIISILQHARVVDNSCCIVFPTSRCPYLILCPR